MDPKISRLYRFALWLIRLRWLGVICIIVVTFLASRILDVAVRERSLYIVSAIFFILNLLHRLLLLRFTKGTRSDPARFLKICSNIQISTDFLILTLLLHFSGGIENPFIVYFIFHMVMASIVLSPRESYIQASFAWSLVILLASLEYSGILTHYPLEGFVSHGLFESRIYLFGTGLVFISTSYLVVYITNSIVMQSRRHEEAYIRANRELEKKDEIKNEYVLRITHDIKGHLAAIHTCLNVLESKPDGTIDGDCIEFLETASMRTSTLIRFVRDLLYITRLKLSNELKTEYFSFREAIMEVVAQLESKALDKSINFRVAIDDSIDQIRGYRLSIEELISNLLDNAVQYSENGSVVELNVVDQVNQVLIQIKDTGPGIPIHEKDLIFGEFYRGSNHVSTVEGTGLGLAIAKKIVLTHNGRIWVEDAEGKGSKFSVTLPL